jgi:hypothetical protein
MEQLQQLNLLRESNIMLRDESQRNLRKLKECQDKISSLEGSISPLLGIFINNISILLCN